MLDHATANEIGSAVYNILWVTTVLALIVGNYFLPSFIAFARKHHNKAPILILNLFLGWTGLGWIVALIWASTATDRERVRQVRGY